MKLPNSCRVSVFTVNPSDWNDRRKTSIKKPWRITYRFYDPRFKDTKDWGKLISIKGMNRAKTLEERREYTELLIKNEKYMLSVEGYNPITKKSHGTVEMLNGIIADSDTLENSLRKAFSLITLSDSSMRNIKTSKKYFIESAASLNFDRMQLSDLKRAHVRAILNRQAEVNKYTSKRFNSVRADMMTLFEEILASDAIEYNPVKGIKKKKVIVKKREVLTDSEFLKVTKFLKNNYPSFYRFVMIFFYSGCRASELMRITLEDVKLDTMEFSVRVEKGRSHKISTRAINRNALSYWVEVCKEAEEGQFLFARGLSPSDKPINEWQVYKRWRVHVKEKLGITADFYSLKHLYTTKIIESYGDDLAASVNGHASSLMNEKHYDVLREKRMLKAAQEVDIRI